MNGFPTIEPALRDEALAALSKNVATLQPGREYRARDLFGSKAWRRKARWSRIQIGHAFAHEVALGRTPLVSAGRTSCNKQLYRLRD